MDYPGGQSSRTPRPSPSSIPPIGTKERHGDIPPRSPLFWKCLDARRRAPGKLQLRIVRAASLRVYLGSSSFPWRPPGMTPRSPTQPPLQWLVGPSLSPCCAHCPGRSARSRGRGSFHPPPLSSLLSSAFRAGLTPGWAEPSACSERGEAGAS